MAITIDELLARADEVLADDIPYGRTWFLRLIRDLAAALRRHIGYWEDTRKDRSEQFTRAEQAEAALAKARGLLERCANYSFASVMNGEPDPLHDVRAFLAGGGDK